MPGASVWSRFTFDPRHPEHAHLRAADRDRDVVNDTLGTAYAEGRITAEELDERSGRAAAAKTLGELPPLIQDLVAPTASRPVLVDMHTEAVRRYRQQRQRALYGFLTPTLICWAIWAAAGADGFMWPIFVTIGTLMPLLRLLTSREDTIDSIEQGLERREAKRLAAQRRRDGRALPRRQPPFGPTNGPPRPW